MGNNLKSVREQTDEMVKMLSYTLGCNAQGSIALAVEIASALQEREEDRQNAYHERNQLVAFLSRLYPSHLAMHPAEDTEWDPAWRTIVCIHAETPLTRPSDYLQWDAPLGFRPDSWQLTWHVHDSELSLFAHLEMRANDWDEHSTEEKYDRLRRLP